MTRIQTLTVLIAGLGAGAALAAGPQGHPQLSDLDTDGDGQLSATELSALPTRGGRSSDERFTQLDTNDDGYVSQAEMQQMRQRAREHRPQLSDLDADGDGQLSATELSALPTRGGRSSDERFAQLDTNDDGYVSAEELQSGPRSGRP